MGVLLFNFQGYQERQTEPELKTCAPTTFNFKDHTIRHTKHVNLVKRCCGRVWAEHLHSRAKKAAAIRVLPVPAYTHTYQLHYFFEIGLPRMLEPSHKNSTYVHGKSKSGQKTGHHKRAHMALEGSGFRRLWSLQSHVHPFVDEHELEIKLTANSLRF